MARRARYRPVPARLQARPESAIKGGQAHRAARSAAHSAAIRGQIRICRAPVIRASRLRAGRDGWVARKKLARSLKVAEWRVQAPGQADKPGPRALPRRRGSWAGNRAPSGRRWMYRRIYSQSRSRPWSYELALIHIAVPFSAKKRRCKQVLVSGPHVNSKPDADRKHEFWTCPLRPTWQVLPPWQARAGRGPGADR